jgi:hypothetical protein
MDVSKRFSLSELVAMMGVDLTDLDFTNSPVLDSRQ